MGGSIANPRPGAYRPGTKTQAVFQSTGDCLAPPSCSARIGTLVSSWVQHRIHVTPGQICAVSGHKNRCQECHLLFASAGRSHSDFNRDMVAPRALLAAEAVDLIPAVAEGAPCQCSQMRVAAVC